MGILDVGCQRVKIRSALSVEQDQSQNSNFVTCPMKPVICSNDPCLKSVEIFNLNLTRHLNIKFSENNELVKNVENIMI
jgi:hypothetical protein